MVPMERTTSSQVVSEPREATDLQVKVEANVGTECCRISTCDCYTLNVQLRLVCSGKSSNQRPHYVVVQSKTRFGIVACASR